MRSTRIHIAFVALMLAWFVSMATTLLPHHHHEDGRICLTLATAHHGDAQHHHGDEDDPLGCDSCPMKLQALSNTPQNVTHGDRLFLMPVPAVLSNLPELPALDEHGEVSPYVYIEHHCLCVVCTLCGLRAPPVCVA